MQVKQWGTLYLGHFLRKVDAVIAHRNCCDELWVFTEIQAMWDVDALEQVTGELRSELPEDITFSWETQPVCP